MVLVAGMVALERWRPWRSELGADYSLAAPSQIRPGDAETGDTRAGQGHHHPA